MLSHCSSRANLGVSIIILIFRGFFSLRLIWGWSGRPWELRLNIAARTLQKHFFISGFTINTLIKICHLSFPSAMLPFAILVITMELLLGNAGLSFPPAIAIPRSSSKFTCNENPHYTADLVDPWVLTVVYFAENENQLSNTTH